MLRCAAVKSPLGAGVAAAGRREASLPPSCPRAVAFAGHPPHRAVPDRVVEVGRLHGVSLRLRLARLRPPLRAQGKQGSDSPVSIPGPGRGFAAAGAAVGRTPLPPPELGSPPRPRAFETLVFHS